MVWVPKREKQLLAIQRLKPFHLREEQKPENILHAPQLLCLKNYHWNSVEKIRISFLPIAITIKCLPLPSDRRLQIKDRFVFVEVGFLWRSQFSSDLKKILSLKPKHLKSEILLISKPILVLWFQNHI